MAQVLFEDINDPRSPESHKRATPDDARLKSLSGLKGDMIAGL